jgi:hypothetical protein
MEANKFPKDDRLYVHAAKAYTSRAEVVASLLKPAYVQVWRAFHTDTPA